MGFEIPIDNDYPDHPKTLQLIALVGPQADVYPLRLWFYASKYRRDGVFKGGPLEVEEACKWRGGSGKLAEALIKVELLEVDGKTLHGWMDGIGRAILIYEEKKRLKREKYAREHGLVPEQSREKDTYQRDSGDSGDSGGEGRGPGSPPSSPTAKKIVEAYRKVNKSVPEKSCLKHVSDALGAGANPSALLQLMTENGKRMKIWKICDQSLKASDGKDFTPSDSRCSNCGGSREVAGGVSGGKILRVPCPRCTRKRGVS